MFPVGARPLSGVVAWLVTDVRSSVCGQFETHSLSGCMAGLEAQRQSNIVNSFSCEEFLSGYYLILKLIVFLLKLPTCVSLCTGAVSLLGELPHYLSDGQ